MKDKPTVNDIINAEVLEVDRPPKQNLTDFGISSSPSIKIQQVYHH